MTFNNPYAVDRQVFSGDDKNVCRAPATISVTDYEFIRSIRPRNGTINTTQNILWHKLCEALRLAGITDISSQRDFEDFVTNVRFVDGRKPAKAKKNGVKS